MTDKQHKEIIAKIDQASGRIVIYISIVAVFIMIFCSCTAQRPAVENHHIEYYYNRPVPVENLDLKTK